MSKGTGVLAGQDEAISGVVLTEAEPHVGAWEPAPDISKMLSVKATGIGSKALKSRRAKPSRGLIGGKRTVAMWKTKGDDTYLIELRAGDHVQRLRLSEDTLDAIETLRAESKGVQVWRMVLRTAVDAARTPPLASDEGPGMPPENEVPQ